MNGPYSHPDQTWWIDSIDGPIAPKTSLTRSKLLARDQLFEVFPRLTLRDREICFTLFDHKVLTIHQLYELFFDHPRRARRRLLELFRIGVVFRFRPYEPTGSSPYHYVIGPLGIELVGADRGIVDRELRFRVHRIRTFAKSQRLPHLLEVNSFFTRLALACRAKSRFDLAEWWNEERCYRAWGTQVRPDAAGILQTPSGPVRFLLEIDRGTEDFARLRRKQLQYSGFTLWDGQPRVVLFTFPSVRREQAARNHLLVPGLVVATTTRMKVQEAPLDEIWLPVATQKRVSLDGLVEGAGLIPLPEKRSS